MSITTKKNRTMTRKSVNDFYAEETAGTGGVAQFTESDHIAAMWKALNRAHAAGFCGCDVEQNGDGFIYNFTFHRGEEKPRFACNSGDVFRQIQIS